MSQLNNETEEANNDQNSTGSISNSDLSDNRSVNGDNVDFDIKVERLLLSYGRDYKAMTDIGADFADRIEHKKHFDTLMSLIANHAREVRISENEYWGQDEGGENWRKKEMCQPYLDRIAELETKS